MSYFSGMELSSPIFFLILAEYLNKIIKDGTLQEKILYLLSTTSSLGI